MLSSLSSVPPVMPSPRPEIIGTFSPHAARAGASTRDTWPQSTCRECEVHIAGRCGCHLVPDPAGAVLVHHEVAVGGGPLQAHAAAHHGAGEARRLLSVAQCHR